jgi:hypothetical protein
VATPSGNMNTFVADCFWMNCVQTTRSGFPTQERDGLGIACGESGHSRGSFTETLSGRLKGVRHMGLPLSLPTLTIRRDRVLSDSAVAGSAPVSLLFEEPLLLCNKFFLRNDALFSEVIELR